MTQLPRRMLLARRLVLPLVLVVAGGLLTTTATQSVVRSPDPTAPAGRPNVVVIMADDMRKDDLRWMPQTRRLIAGQGARFSNSFAPYPLCCPARASFLTGQYTHNHHVWSHREPYGFPSLDDSSTLPVWLQSAGYNTLFLGKYLNGYGKQPLRDGTSSVTYVPPGWTDWRGSIDGGVPVGDPMDGGTYRYFDMTLNVNGTLEPHQGEYSTRMLGDQSVDLIQSYAGSSDPFFLWASYLAPHHGGPREADDPREVLRNDGKTTQIVTPAVPDSARGRFDAELARPLGFPTERDVSDKPTFIRTLPQINKAERQAMLEAARQRAESLSVLDAEVASTIAALRDTGELGNTIVMLTSDNGYFQGEHRMRQGKTLPYEASLRTPLVMRGPGIPAGVTRPAPFLSIDFAPTILQAAGASLPGSIDGQGRLGVARNGGGGWGRPVLTESGPRETVAMASETGTKLRVPAPKAAAGRAYSTGVRTENFLYVEHQSGEVELYDMRVDPGQLSNVAGTGSYAGEQRRLARTLRDLRHCAGAECR